MRINEKQFILGLSMTQNGKDISTLRDVLRRSQMHVPQNNLESAKELATLVQNGTYQSRLEQVRPLDNGTGLYYDFQKQKPMQYPNEGRTSNQNNVINEVHKLAKNIERTTYDDAVMKIFDTLETSKAYFPLSEFKTMEKVKTMLNDNTPAEKIASEFVNTRNENGSINISDLNF